MHASLKTIALVFIAASSLTVGYGRAFDGPDTLLTRATTSFESVVGIPATSENLLKPIREFLADPSKSGLRASVAIDVLAAGGPIDDRKATVDLVARVFEIAQDSATREYAALGYLQLDPNRARGPVRRWFEDVNSLQLIPRAHLALQLFRIGELWAYPAVEELLKTTEPGYDAVLSDLVRELEKFDGKPTGTGAIITIKELRQRIAERLVSRQMPPKVKNEPASQP